MTGHGKDQVTMMLRTTSAASVLMPEERGPQPDKGPGLPGQKPPQSEGSSQLGRGHRRPLPGKQAPGHRSEGLERRFLNTVQTEETRQGQGAVVDTWFAKITALWGGCHYPVL